jgi:hypothetical protein
MYSLLFGARKTVKKVSPKKRSASPKKRSKSPKKTKRSHKKRSASPKKRSHSPKKAKRSGKKKSKKSPKKGKRSPKKGKRSGKKRSASKSPKKGRGRPRKYHSGMRRKVTNKRNVEVEELFKSGRFRRIFPTFSKAGVSPYINRRPGRRGKASRVRVSTLPRFAFGSFGSGRSDSLMQAMGPYPSMN